LEIAAGTYEQWMFDAALKRLAGNIQELHEGMAEEFRPYHKRSFSGQSVK
jgi:hypothetical protein